KEHMNPEKLKVFADKLKSKEIVNSKYDNLIVDIQQEKLQNPIDFLNYCNKAVIISEQDYPNEPEKYLELIHKKTASIIPKLSFENFLIITDCGDCENRLKRRRSANFATSLRGKQTHLISLLDYLIF